MKVVFVYLASLFAVCLSIGFNKVLNSAISHAKNLYKSRFTKDKSWHFLGYDPTEYPRTNERYQKLHREKWQEYYDCLLKQEEELKYHGSMIPEAVLAIEGESVKFECEICLSPTDRDDINSVDWEWSSVYENYLQSVEITEHVFISPKDKTLQLYNLRIEQTGQYICKLKNLLTVPYFLTIVNASEPLQEVRHEKVLNKIHPERPWLIHQEIVLDTMWREWSPCSNCDKIGKKRKFGYCIILLKENLKSLIFEKNDTDVELNSVIKKQFVKIPRNDIEMLHIFKYGIPCRSHILPQSIKNNIHIKQRKSEILTMFCKVKCEGNKIFIVKDNKGNVLEKANNTAGIYSMLQGIPETEPVVERRLTFAASNTKVILTCPGNLNSEAPIKWQIGSKHIIPELLSRESHGRMFVTILDKLVIKIAHESDTNIYSCWQENELTGMIRLIVEKQFKLNFNHHIMLFNAVVILGTFFIIFLKAFLRSWNE